MQIEKLVAIIYNSFLITKVDVRTAKSFVEKLLECVSNEL